MSDNETLIYEAISSGDWDSFWDLQSDLDFWTDYNNAYAHYQRDHETPAEERMELVEQAVAEENAHAREVSFEIEEEA